MDEAEFKKIHDVAKEMGIDAQKVYDWRAGFDYSRSNAGRPPGKRKRSTGMLSVGDCLREYGIKGTVLRKWRDMGMPTERNETMIMVSRQVLGQWMEDHVDDLD